MLTTGSHMNRMTSWRPESAYVFTESFVDPSRAALHKDNTHTKHKKKQKNTRALNHTTMPPLFYTQEILHRFHWTHFSLNFLPQTFRRTCLILWLLCTSWLMLQSFMILYVLPLGREWSEWSGGPRVARLAQFDVARLRFWRSGCARDHCMELQAAVKMNAGSCYIWSRFPRGKSRQQDM